MQVTELIWDADFDCPRRLRWRAPGGQTCYAAHDTGGRGWIVQLKPTDLPWLVVDVTVTVTDDGQHWQTREMFGARYLVRDGITTSWPAVDTIERAAGATTWTRVATLATLATSRGLSALIHKAFPPTVGPLR